MTIDIRPSIFSVGSELGDNRILLTCDEVSLYFELRNGRLWSLSSTYPLPVDMPEQTRQREHCALLRIAGPNDTDCFMELERCLASSLREPVRALDMGTGCGEWVVNMAVALPEVHFYGIDIVPIFTRCALPNVRFELQDLNDDLYYPDQHMDVVRAHDVSLGVERFPNLISEAARILKYGGVLSICEWQRCIHINDGSDIAIRAPKACAFLMALTQHLHVNYGISPVVSSVKVAIEQEPNLAALHHEFSIPIGDWPVDAFMRSVGTRYRQVLVGYAIAMIPFLTRVLRAEDVDDLVGGFISDLYYVRGLSTTYYSGYAIRI
ncbi:hypothetical protein ONZ51_g12826 [Trametes cubensis]|uniref:Methyltransferase domain-containing protein n=1 Tax=Trametes cubensis TaxID=1111947 RepID=A0AAD7X543_9APHY|nr:hypothetical protein ONZ51_g12826 [Trametes cubensis]